MPPFMPQSVLLWVISIYGQPVLDAIVLNKAEGGGNFFSFQEKAQGWPQQGTYPGLCGVISESRHCLCSKQCQKPQTLGVPHTRLLNPSSLREELQRLPGEQSAGGKGSCQSLIWPRAGGRMRKERCKAWQRTIPEKPQLGPSISLPLRFPSPETTAAISCPARAEFLIHICKLDFWGSQWHCSWSHQKE